MAPDKETPDDLPRRNRPMHPDDRIWRHPSELAHGTQPPAAWGPSPSSAPRRSSTPAIVGACLTGVALTFGVLWLARPVVVKNEQAREPASSTVATTIARFVAAELPTASLTREVAPALVEVQVEVGGQWSAGTGVRIDSSGSIAVATPLLSGAGQLVITSGGKKRVATQFASDPATGMTVVRSSDRSGRTLDVREALVRPGQPVAVVGMGSAGNSSDPWALPVTVTATGVRSVADDLVLHDAIELDRTLPAEAVGCPVIDAKGALVGFVITPSDASGRGVVVPAAEAMAAARDLSVFGEVRRAWLGVQATDLDPAVAAELAVVGGAVIDDVDELAPAWTGGLRVGDVLTKVEDRTILDASDLVLAIRASRPGDEVEVLWIRDGVERRAAIILGG